MLSAFFQITGFVCKSRGYHLAQKICNSVLYWTYLAPLIASLWLLRDIHADRILESEGHQMKEIFWTQLRRWLMIEQFTFLGMVISGVFFLASAIVSRMLSIWNENKRRFIVTKERVLLNVWTMRSGTDFLHYLKFEYMQSTFYGGFLFVGLLVWWIGDNTG